MAIPSVTLLQICQFSDIWISNCVLCRWLTLMQCTGMRISFSIGATSISGLTPHPGRSVCGSHRHSHPLGRDETVGPWDGPGYSGPAPRDPPHRPRRRRPCRSGSRHPPVRFGMRRKIAQGLGHPKVLKLNEDHP